MATLYLTEVGTRLEKEYNRLRVKDKDGKSLMVVPISRVTEVVLVGWAGVTTPAMLALLEADISLTLISRQGKIRGRLTPPTGKNIPLRKAQYRQSDDPNFQLALSRAIVAGKLRNSRTMARRILADIDDEPPGQMGRIIKALKAINTCTDIATLMSYEGQAAHAYFAILRRALNEKLPFGSRTRRPPRDPVNALLSLGYSLLTADIISALEIVGLDPYCGFFHRTVYGRPALALDLMEEFRPIITDSVVLTLVNKRIITADDFQPAKTKHAGIYLTQLGLRKFLTQYTQRLQTKIYHPLAQRPLSYQKIFEVQARQIAKLIQKELDEYTPFVVR